VVVVLFVGCGVLGLGVILCVCGSVAWWCGGMVARWLEDTPSI